MKTSLITLAAIAVIMASCGETQDPASSSNGSSGAEADGSKIQPLMTQSAAPEPGGGGTSGGSGSAAASSMFIPKVPAQQMIDAYGNSMLSGVATRYYLADAIQLRSYLDHAISQGAKDVQIILARNPDELTLVLTMVKPDGTHILYPDPNNNDTPSVIENCMPCPPGTNCYTSTNLSQ